jgi:hypothetical protein
MGEGENVAQRVILAVVSASEAAGDEDRPLGGNPLVPQVSHKF